MDKIQFTHQRWNLRFWILVIVLAFCGAMLMVLDRIGIHLIDYISRFIPGFIFWFSVVAIYFKLTDKMFIQTGRYWVEDGIVCVEAQSRIYKLTNVQVLSGAKISWLVPDHGMLYVKYGNKKLRLYSRSYPSLETFADCELYKLFEFILANNHQLQNEEDLDFHYEAKKS